MATYAQVWHCINLAVRQMVWLLSLLQHFRKSAEAVTTFYHVEGCPSSSCRKYQ